MKIIQELADDNVICPHCSYETNIGRLVGETTDNCPACGGVILNSLEIKNEED
jgi:Zn-finger nucleic acid-binding protein